MQEPVCCLLKKESAETKKKVTINTKMSAIKIPRNSTVVIDPFNIEDIQSDGKCACEHVGFNERLDGKKIIAFETFFCDGYIPPSPQI